MRDLLSWNISLGRWAGVHVRVHMFFLLFAAVIVGLSTRDGDDALVSQALAILAVLLASVLWHELGHCFWARHVSFYSGGGRSEWGGEQIVIWPLGGLIHVGASHEPQHEVAISLAGPIANLLLCIPCAFAIWLFGEQGGSDLASLLNPLVPPGWAVAGFGWFELLRWTFWINWFLALVNLLPVFPFDCGRLVRCLLRGRSSFGGSSAALAFGMAVVIALALVLGAWWAHGSERYSYAALPLLLLGMLVFFSARQELEWRQDGDPDDAPFGYDFSQGYTSLERAGPAQRPSSGGWRKWLDERRAERLRRQQQLEAEEERRVDDVLARLHESGLHTLSDEDRALLDRVSARYRNRLRH